MEKINVRNAKKQASKAHKQLVKQVNKEVNKFLSSITSYPIYLYLGAFSNVELAFTILKERGFHIEKRMGYISLYYLHLSVPEKEISNDNFWNRIFK